jgi:predicted ribosomally synthesized peptide with nif11-like leader
MSIETVKQFLQKAETTPDLQKQIQAIPKGAGTRTVAEFVKVADVAGYKFTAQDYDDAVTDVLAQKHAAGALNDVELALVTGGLMCTSTDQTTCTCCPNPKPPDGTTHGVIGAVSVTRKLA